MAYVFMVLLPKLSDWQVMVAQMQRESLVATSLGPQEIESVKKFLIYEVFASTLAGLVVFYGLERAIYWLKLRQKKENRASVLAIGLFGLNIAYNTLIGYILVHSQIPGKLAPRGTWQ
ncbi:MAG: hypothetical protein P8X49_13915 [Syntrophobacterales bacterium]